ncbi:hypothetical protein VNO77_23476 [Canavalia gladiata]|uniref:Uncharacterized protein n=1 Tax=Canavalia gladiata TaxID=3824 RepID=A0AAN9L4H7_CANGL
MLIASVSVNLCVPSNDRSLFYPILLIAFNGSLCSHVAPKVLLQLNDVLLLNSVGINLKIPYATVIPNLSLGRVRSYSLVHLCDMPWLYVLPCLE